MKPLSIGKLRGLQQCSIPGATLAVLALDHRNNLRNALNPQSPQSVSDAELTAFKLDVVSALAPHASAVLLDPEVGASQCIASGAVPGSIGLVVSTEASGYTGDPAARESRILPGWSIAKSRRMGASAVKLLVYYHPEARTAAQIEAFVREVAQECIAQDMTLFLETLSYPVDASRKKLLPEERRRVVVETARRLVMPGVDVLKAEFPLDITAAADEKVWIEACAELSTACPVPWVVLSASVPYDTFLRQVTAACRGGATGVAVGRAVWQEATSLTQEARRSFLEGEASRRMMRITALCQALARPWTEFYKTELPGSDWYKDY